MLGQVARLGRFFSVADLLAQMSTMKRARAPLRGYLTTVCFWALADAGVLDALEASEPATLESLARPRGLDAKILGFVCQYLARLGRLDLDGDRVRWTRKGRRFWRDCGPVLRLFHGYQPLFETLGAQLEGRARFGEDLFRREASVAGAFSELGRSFIFPIMAQILARERFRGIVELGCAEAELSRYVCERDPALRCLGVDASKGVLDAARARVAREGLGDRIELAEGDIFRIASLPGDLSRYDVVTAIDLFHGYLIGGETGLVDMFGGLRGRFAAQRLLISEIILPSERRIARIAYPTAEHELFHGLTHQQSFRPGQLEALLDRAGWQLERSWNLNDVAGRVFLLLG